MIFRKKPTPQEEPSSVKTVDVLWCCDSPPEIIESVFSYGYCRKTSYQLCRSQLNLLSWHEPASRQEISDCLNGGELTADCLLVVTNPELVTGPAAVKQMMKSLGEGGAGVALPVFNETAAPLQMAKLPGIYLNLSTYLEVTEMLPRKKVAVPGSESDADCSCVLIQREFVNQLKSIVASGEDLKDALTSLVSSALLQGGCVVDPSALIHSFGNYYGGKREDLVDLVPESAQTVLDVGCANGGFGELMGSKRSNIHLTGVEMNSVMAENASGHYDMIHTMKIEDVDFDRSFDHINCGDIIEHLYEPWEMLKLFHSLLNKGGSLVISLPNAGHWTIVKDLAAGEFQYLPVGLLCMTHIRWFTEKSIRQALEDAGFEVERFQREQVPPTPRGEAFIELLCKNGMGDRTSLSTNQFTLRALKK